MQFENGVEFVTLYHTMEIGPHYYGHYTMP